MYLAVDIHFTRMRSSYGTKSNNPHSPFWAAEFAGFLRENSTHHVFHADQCCRRRVGPHIIKTLPLRLIQNGCSLPGLPWGSAYGHSTKRWTWNLRGWSKSDMSLNGAECVAGWPPRGRCRISGRSHNRNVFSYRTNLLEADPLPWGRPDYFSCHFRNPANTRLILGEYMYNR